MTSSRRQFLRIAAGGAALPAVSRAAMAETYPARPITMIIPFAAGGPTDVVGRLLAERMSGSLGQSVIAENSTGAGGTIGVGRLARAAPDGYTLGMGIWSTHVVNGAIYTLQYDLVKDFAPVMPISRELGMVIVAKKTNPANDLRELIEWLKANGGRATFGTAGVGSPPHVAGALFANLSGAPFQLVHYRGASQVAQDLVAGHIDMRSIARPHPCRRCAPALSSLMP
jgi:tripartite-type tricarboxylate transporter receptor subunit TctC